MSRAFPRLAPCREPGAKLGRGGVAEVGHGHNVILRADDQSAEIHRPDDVVDHPRGGLVNDATRQRASSGVKVAPGASHNIHGRQEYEAA